MKRIVSLVLALSMVLSMFSMSFAGTGLKDIEDTKYEAAVEALIELGVVKGYPDGTYMPDNVVTRAELAKLLVVAYGLEPAAEASKGVTPFDDVNAINHWASGYINVSADYKFVNGYPDGSFKGDETVTYAEAITMCLRVLGYANEVDSKGTWPTNYIAKAQDLKLMKNIDFKSYNDGAKRGDIALLIWNMLRTKMWTVTGETEGDGLQSNPNRLMLDVKFADYDYEEEARFSEFKIEEGKVYMKLAGDSTWYEYAKNDFYKFVGSGETVPGTEVEVLLNTEEELMLTIVPTGEEDLLDATPEYLTEEEYNNVPEDVHYVYSIVDDEDIMSARTLTVESTYVEEVEFKTDYVRINDAMYESDRELFKEEIVIKDDKRVSIKELKAGDVINKVTVDNTEVFFVIGSEEAEGKLTQYVTAKNRITVDGKEYFLNDATFVEDPEDEDEDAKEFATASNQGYKFEDMKNEEVTIICEPISNRVVRIEFDGNIGDDSDVTYGFFETETVVYDDVDEEIGKRHYVKLGNENGSDPYMFSEDIEDADITVNGTQVALNTLEGDKAYKNCFGFVAFDEDGEIVEFHLFATKDNGSFTVAEGSYGEENEYAVTNYSNVEYENNSLVYKVNGEDKKVYLTDSLVVVKLLTSEEDSKVTYDVEFDSDMDALEALNGEEDATVIANVEEDFKDIMYVLIKDDVVSSDLTFGKVEESVKNEMEKYDIELLLAQDPESSEKKTITVISEEDVSDAFVAFKTKVNKDDEYEFTYVAGLRADELNSTWANHGYVASVINGGRRAMVNPTLSADIVEGTTIDMNLDDEDVAKKYEDYKGVVIEVSEDATTKEDKTDFVVDSFVEVSVDDLEFKVGDRISEEIVGNTKIMYVIRGMGKVATTPATPANP